MTGVPPWLRKPLYIYISIYNHYSPLLTIINHYQPLFTTINHYSPLFAILSHHWTSMSCFSHNTTGRFYSGKLIQAEYTTVSDFREARCRAFHETRCNRGAYCHLVFSDGGRSAEVIWNDGCSSWGMYLTGWWFGTFFIIPYIGNNHPNWLIFFRGVQTTNQLTSEHLRFLCDFLSLSID